METHDIHISNEQNARRILEERLDAILGSAGKELSSVYNKVIERTNPHSRLGTDIVPVISNENNKND